MISASAVTTRHELIMNLVVGLSLINKVWKRAVNRIMIKIRAMTARIFSYSGQRAKTSFKFTDKAFVFADLSVSKTHFTDKPAFSGDLSVNFGPLC